MTVAPKAATDDRSSGSLSGLTARVAYTDEQIKQLRGDFTSFKDSVGVQFDRSREQNAQAIGEMNSNVARQIERLGSELREQGKTKGTNWIGVWGVAFAAVGALVVLAGAILAPINGSLGDTKISFEHVANTFEKINEQFARRDDIREDGKRRDATINKIEERLAGIEQNFLTRTEHSEFKARIDQSTALEHEYRTRDQAATNQRLDAIEGSLIKRPEITALLGNLATQISADEHKIDDLAREFGATYGVGDELKALRAQYEQLSSRVFGLVIAAPPPSGKP